MLQWSYYCVPTTLRYEEIILLCKLGDISATHNHLMMKNLSKLKIILLVTRVSICMQYLSYENSLPLHTPTSVCIFSSLFSIHLQRSWLGESVYQSKASLVGDHLLYSRDHNLNYFVKKRKIKCVKIKCV